MILFINFKKFYYIKKKGISKMNNINISVQKDNELNQNLSDYERRVVNKVFSILTSHGYNANFNKTTTYISIYLSNNTRKWVCRLNVKDIGDSTLTFHNYQGNKDELIYYFQNENQFNIIDDVFDKFAKAIGGSTPYNGNNKIIKCSFCNGETCKQHPFKKFIIRNVYTDTNTNLNVCDICAEDLYNKTRSN